MYDFLIDLYFNYLCKYDICDFMLNPTEVFLNHCRTKRIATVTSDWPAFCWLIDWLIVDQTCIFWKPNGSNQPIMNYVMLLCLLATYNLLNVDKF